MGGLTSIFDGDGDDESKHVEILDSLSQTLGHWQTKISDMRENKLPDTQALACLFQEMLDGKNKLDRILHQLAGPSQQPLGPKQMKVPSNAPNAKQNGHESLALQRDLELYREKSKSYKKVNDELFEMYVAKENALKVADEEKKEILLRLSKVTGERLKTDNPNIADLGDQHRPTKLAEMLSELYDNEWTDAFEALEVRGRSHRSSVRILLQTFMDAFIFCKNKRSEFFTFTPVKMKELIDGKVAVYTKTRLKRSRSEAALDMMTLEHETETVQGQPNSFLSYEWLDNSGLSCGGECGGDQTMQEEDTNILAEEFENKLQSLQEETNKQVRLLLKKHGESLSPLVEQSYMRTRWTKDSQEALKPYIRKCVHIAWLMCIQMPPMIVADMVKSGDKFDSTFYREYTVKGSLVDYIVWPAILLHHNGPVLLKGVAQGKDQSNGRDY